MVVMRNKFAYFFSLLAFFLAQGNVFALSAKERACASMYYSCEGKKQGSEICLQMKKLMKDLKYSCKGTKNKVNKVFNCYKNNEQYSPKYPNWLAVAWDNSNPKIYGYCDNPGAETARKCAIKKCIDKGGKSCSSICNKNDGRKLRACRLGVQTYVASSSYGRFGCGTRYIKNGTFTPNEYARRELKRCINASKHNDCMVHELWQ